MIVFAADYVGNEVVKFICNRKEQIEVFVYDTNNRGSFNDEMISTVLSANPSAMIINQMDLKMKSVQNQIKERRIEIGFLAWWPYIITEAMINLTLRGFVNTHPGFLPYNRGKHPYFWSIVDGTPFGVTLHFVDTGIDHGPIIAQEEIPVSWLDTGESLYVKSRNAILRLFYSNYDSIMNNTIAKTFNCTEKGTFHQGKELEPFCTIELDRQYTARTLLNILRGRMFNGKGAAGFTENGKEYLVSIEITEKE